MISKTTTIVNPQGFHMRPASLMTAEAAKYASTITLVAGGKEIPANSLMAIMAAGIKCGDEVEVRALAPTKRPPSTASWPSSNRAWATSVGCRPAETTAERKRA